MRYLGVPILSTKLAYGDCKPILDRVRSWVCSWCSRSLSFGGRFQLAHSVLITIYLYWASVFLLTKGVIEEIECIIRNFLWSGLVEDSQKVKVA